MKIAFALYDGFSVLDFAALFEPLAKAVSGSSAACALDICAAVSEVYDATGLHFYPTCRTPTLQEYDLVIIPGGAGAAEGKDHSALLRWLGTAGGAKAIIGVNEGADLAVDSGLAEDGRMRLDAGLDSVSHPAPSEKRMIRASGPEGARAAAAWLVEQSGVKAGAKLTPGEAFTIPVTGQAAPAPARRSVVKRETGETRVEIRLDLDGTGRHEISTGLPFLDHMLTQIAVHGLFDLYVKADGDLHIDPHHTTEDTALTLGAAFLEALGDRKGITRMASADCPMDESLAWAAVDFSGRPYCVLNAEWHGPAVGGLPVSLISHFFESFAINARCNLHAAVRYGRDDHHQVEAIFKAVARALCAATRIDPRRQGQVPSSKGILF